MKNKNLLLGFCALIYAMLLAFMLISNFTAREAEHWRFFYAFTQQSNIIALIWLILYGVNSFVKLPIDKFINNRLLITAITVYTSITFFIVVFVLNPVFAGQWQPLESSSEFFLHNATPVVMWLFFFLVPGLGKTKPIQALYILIYPIIYLFCNIAIGMNFTYLDGKPAFAYGFTNPANYSNILFFAAFILVLIGIFALFGLALMQLKKKINRDYFDIVE